MKRSVLFLLITAMLFLLGCWANPRIIGKVSKITMEGNATKIHFDDGRTQTFRDVPQPIVGKDCSIEYNRVGDPYPDEITHIDCE